LLKSRTNPITTKRRLNKLQYLSRQQNPKTNLKKNGNEKSATEPGFLILDVHPGQELKRT
jgi:hypothetical protein